MSRKEQGDMLNEKAKALVARAARVAAKECRNRADGSKYRQPSR